MHIMLSRMKSFGFRHLNQRSYTFSDVERFCKRERIKLTICECADDILGYFCVSKTPRRTKKFIVINSKLDPVTRTFVGLHELAHYCLHVPVSTRQYFYCRRNAERTKEKHDCEANNFALLAMIPVKTMLDLAATGYRDIDPVLMNFCVRRQQLWERYEKFS